MNHKINIEILHFLFFTERILGPLKLISAISKYPKDSDLCETAVLAQLESVEGVPVNLLASVGGVQTDRQEITIKGSKSSRRICDFHRDTKSLGGDFLPIREWPKDLRAESLKLQRNPIHPQIYLLMIYLMIQQLFLKLML